MTEKPAGTKLNVLLLESERRAADMACDALEAAGHAVVRCHEPGMPTFPCNALAEGKACPLEAGVVDVALDVRSRPRSQPSQEEDGVACAIRHGVPLVVAGATVMNPFEDYATATVEAGGDVAAACERAAHAPLRAHTEAAARALRDVLDRRELRVAPVVAVRRRHGALLVEVTVADLAESTKSMAAVRMAAALREIDHHARGIDVVFRSPQGTSTNGRSR